MYMRSCYLAANNQNDTALQMILRYAALFGCRYWYTSRQQRMLDYGLSVRDNMLLDGDGKKLYDIPKNYAGWAGYNDSAHTCRQTGPLGLVNRTAAGVWCV
jgi:hypothetical protein